MSALAQQESDRSGPNIAQLPHGSDQKRKLLLIVDVVIGEGRQIPINIYEGDQPEQLAEQFVTTHGIRKGMIRPIARHIASQLEAVVPSNGSSSANTSGSNSSASSSSGQQETAKGSSRSSGTESRKTEPQAPVPPSADDRSSTPQKGSNRKQQSDSAGDSVRAASPVNKGKATVESTSASQASAKHWDESIEQNGRRESANEGSKNSSQATFLQQSGKETEQLPVSKLADDRQNADRSGKSLKTAATVPENAGASRLQSYEQDAAPASPQKKVATAASESSPATRSSRGQEESSQAASSAKGNSTAAPAASSQSTPSTPSTKASKSSSESAPPAGEGDEYPAITGELMVRSSSGGQEEKWWYVVLYKDKVLQLFETKAKYFSGDYPKDEYEVEAVSSRYTRVPNSFKIVTSDQLVLECAAPSEKYYTRWKDAFEKLTGESSPPSPSTEKKTLASQEAGSTRAEKSPSSSPTKQSPKAKESSESAGKSSSPKPVESEKTKKGSEKRSPKSEKTKNSEQKSAKDLSPKPKTKTREETSPSRSLESQDMFAGLSLTPEAQEKVKETMERIRSQKSQKVSEKSSQRSSSKSEESSKGKTTSRISTSPTRSKRHTKASDKKLKPSSLSKPLSPRRQSTTSVDQKAGIGEEGHSAEERAGYDVPTDNSPGLSLSPKTLQNLKNLLVSQAPYAPYMAGPASVSPKKTGNSVGLTRGANKKFWKQGGYGGVDLSGSRVRRRNSSSPTRRELADRASVASNGMNIHERLYLEAEHRRQLRQKADDNVAKAIRTMSNRTERTSEKSGKRGGGSRSSRDEDNNDNDALDVGERLFQEGMAQLKRKEERVAEREKEKRDAEMENPVKDWMCPACGTFNAIDEDRCQNIVGTARSGPPSWHLLTSDRVVLEDADIVHSRPSRTRPADPYENVRCGFPRPQMFQPVKISKNVSNVNYEKRISRSIRKSLMSATAEAVHCTFVPQIDDRSREIAERGRMRRQKAALKEQQLFQQQQQRRRRKSLSVGDATSSPFSTLFSNQTLLGSTGGVSHLYGNQEAPGAYDSSRPSYDYPRGPGSLNSYDILHYEGLMTQRKLERQQNEKPAGCTFQPKLLQSRYKVVRASRQATIERLLTQHFEKQKHLEDKRKELSQSPEVDEVTGQPFFAPQVGRPPVGGRSSADIGETLYDYHQKYTDTKKGVLKKIEDDVKAAINRRHTLGKSVKMSEEMLTRRFKEIFAEIAVERGSPRTPKKDGSPKLNSSLLEPVVLKDPVVNLTRGNLKGLRVQVQRFVRHALQGFPTSDLSRDQFLTLLHEWYREARNPELTQVLLKAEITESSTDSKNEAKPQLSHVTDKMAKRRGRGIIPVQDVLWVEKEVYDQRREVKRQERMKEEMGECTFQPRLVSDNEKYRDMYAIIDERLRVKDRMEAPQQEGEQEWLRADISQRNDERFLEASGRVSSGYPQHREDFP